jgi:hypothetical protein
MEAVKYPADIRVIIDADHDLACPQDLGRLYVLVKAKIDAVALSFPIWDHHPKAKQTRVTPPSDSAFAHPACMRAIAATMANPNP